MRRFLVVGLGNPGPKYEGTRHNAGMDTVNCFVDSKGLRFSAPQDGLRIARGEGGLMVAKPSVFMNVNGYAVNSSVARYGIPLSQLLVVVDCIKLDVGTLRFARDGGHGGQRGLENVIERLKSDKFHRLRIGVRGDTYEGPHSLADYVLRRGGREEQDVLKQSISKAAEAIDVWRHKGIDFAMNEYNGIKMNKEDF